MTFRERNEAFCLCTPGHIHAYVHVSSVKAGDILWLIGDFIDNSQTKLSCLSQIVIIWPIFPNRKIITRKRMLCDKGASRRDGETLLL
jgi:hypothetical protein